MLVRNAMFRRVELAALRRWIDLGELDAAAGWDAERWQEAIEDYFDEYDSIGIGPDARGPALLQITREPGRWLVRQVIDDPEGDHDWATGGWLLERGRPSSPPGVSPTLISGPGGHRDATRKEGGAGRREAGPGAHCGT